MGEQSEPIGWLTTRAHRHDAVRRCLL